MRIAAVRLRLNIVPPHVFLALAEGPRRLAGHRAALASDAAVDVENESELLVGIRRFVRVIHFAAELPVVNVAHVFRCIVKRLNRYIVTN